MQTKEALFDYKERVELEIEKYFEKKIPEYEKVSPFAGRFTKDLAEFTLRGGKRLRAALVYYAYNLLGGKDDKEIIKTSVFIELIQSFLLIHDDIMDRALLRRNGPTMHKIYAEFSRENKFHDDEHFGISMGILSGDLAKQMALGVIAESDFPDEYKTKLILLVSTEISEVIFGQCHDILLSYDYPRHYTEDDVLMVHKYKTARYTYQLPLFAGAVLGGASDADLKALEGFAIPAGIAFQIRDDILGVFGEEEMTGKETVTDLIEGKKTLLVTEAYKNANLEQKEKLDGYLGKKDLTEEEAEEVRTIFKETGSLDHSMTECKRQVEIAKASLRKLVDKEEGAFTILENIADYMIMRSV